MNMPTSGAAPQATSSRSTTALVLGIIGILCCQLCGPFAWWIGKQELDAIRAGNVAASNEGMAKAGMILGIVGTVLLGLSCVWMFFGGMAVLSGILRGAHSL
ncbi:MAG: DUF4190 domain-containing protein [Acidobacteriota bacterium]